MATETVIDIKKHQKLSVINIILLYYSNTQFLDIDTEKNFAVAVIRPTTTRMASDTC